MCCDTRLGAQHLADGAVLRASARSMAEKCTKRVVLAPARRQVQCPAPEACSMKTPGRRVGLCSDQRQASSNVLPVHIRSADAVQVTSPAAPHPERHTQAQPDLPHIYQTQHLCSTPSQRLHSATPSRRQAGFREDRDHLPGQVRDSLFKLQPTARPASGSKKARTYGDGGRRGKPGGVNSHGASIVSAM